MADHEVGKRGNHEKSDWRELCRLASQEQDSRKLLELLHEINYALTREAEFSGRY